MTEQNQETKCITLKGSAEMLKEYLLYGINSILYQRGIYPPETFEPDDHFGLCILMSTDPKLKKFFDVVLGQIQDWFIQKKVEKVTLIIMNVNTKEVLEKWDFKVDYESEINSITYTKEEVGFKDKKVIQKEIREVLRQITGTVSFLPLLDCLCSFDILTYTKPECDIPKDWDETSPVFIANSQEVQLRSFSTSIHKMDTIVSYKNT